MLKIRRVLVPLSFGLAVLTGLAVLPGCGGEPAVAEEKTMADYFALKIGGQPVRLQIAVRQGEQQRGLMERTALGADEGMVFVYARPQQMSFWMRNTLLPLDIGFFDATGELREVRPLFPRDERTVRSHSAEIQFAVEMNQNWYRDNGVKPGAKLDLAALKAALKARGFEPRRFGIE